MNSLVRNNSYQNEAIYQIKSRSNTKRSKIIAYICNHFLLMCDGLSEKIPALPVNNSIKK